MLPDDFTVEFRPGICQWQLTEERCNQSTRFRKSYCDEHYNMAYQKTTEKGAQAIAEQELKTIEEGNDWDNKLEE